MMEENTRPDPDRPQDPGPGQESNRALLPLLQPPGNQQSNRITNFYIDNILRPDFGRNWKDDVSVHKEDTVAGRTLREQLKEKRAFKSGNPLQDGARAESEEDTRASEDQPPEPEDSTSDLGFEDPAEGQGRGGDSTAHIAQPMLWPAWVYCTRYSDRPSSGPRSRKPKKTPTPSKEDKRPRTAFTAEQLHQLDIEFQNNRYLTEQRRQSLAQSLGLNESQIKIWFQNKRAKIKKASGNKNALALHLRAQGLYNHSTATEHKCDSD